MIFLASEGKSEYDVRGLRFVDFLVVLYPRAPIRYPNPIGTRNGYFTCDRKCGKTMTLTPLTAKVLFELELFLGF